MPLLTSRETLIHLGLIKEDAKPTQVRDKVRYLKWAFERNELNWRKIFKKGFMYKSEDVNKFLNMMINGEVILSHRPKKRA